MIHASVRKQANGLKTAGHTNCPGESLTSDTKNTATASRTDICEDQLESKFSEMIYVGGHQQRCMLLNSWREEHENATNVKVRTTNHMRGRRYGVCSILVSVRLQQREMLKLR